MLVNGTLPNLVDGVSQQPPSQRKATHCDLADNCYLSPTDGLTKRPPFTHIKTIIDDSPPSTNGFPVNLKVHFINRSETERYVMVFQSDANLTKPYVFDLTGTSYPVVFAPGTVSFNYITCASGRPDEDLRCCTIADTTFVSNRGITVSSTLVGNPVYVPTIYFWIRSVTNSAIYRLYVDAGVGSFTSGTTDTTTTIAAGLASALGTSLGAGYTVEQNGPIVAVQKNSHASMQGDYFDPNGGANITMCNSDGCPDFAHVPPAAIQNSVVKILALNNGSAATIPYYVQFRATNFGTVTNNIVQGQWFECPAPANLVEKFDATTMPQQLVRLADDNLGTVTGVPFQIYFQYGPVPWTSRIVGDTTFAPAPSCVGKSINDIFLFQGRLGLLSDTNLLLSQVGSFFNFWRTTMLSVPASDPIDVSAAHPRVVKLRHAIPWQRELVIFGDQVQFVVAADGNAVSPSTITMTAATEYDVDWFCKPIPIANMLYFPYRINGYTGIREYYIEFYTQRHTSRAITDHVPKYLNGNPVQMSHCIASDLLAVLTDNDRSSVYAYKFAWAGNTLYTAEKSQSAWSRWNFDQPNVTTRVYGFGFIGQTMYSVVGRSFTSNDSSLRYEISLESCAVDAIPSDVSPPATPYTTYLDRRVKADSLVAAYNAGLNQTTLTLPYSALPINNTANTVVYYCILSNGYSVPIAGLSGRTGLVLKGNWVGQLGGAYAGVSYTMRYRFSPFFLRETNGQNQQSAVTNGRLQLRTITTRFINTGYFRYEITPFARDMNSVAWTGQTKGDSGMVLGSAPIISDKFRTLVQSRGDRVQIDIVNDTPFPSRFSSAEWEGEFYARSRRV